jgi:hypothetical protein
VVAERDWDKAMAGMAQRLKHRGRTSRAVENVFAGLLRHARDGGREAGLHYECYECRRLLPTRDDPAAPAAERRSIRLLTPLTFKHPQTAADAPPWRRPNAAS